MGKFGKKNEVKLDILSYNTALIGESGIGKTTLIKEVCEQVAGSDGYIFFELGKEDGADAIEGIVYEEVPDWETFEEITDDIIDNKTTDYPNLRVVILDTYDQLMAIAEPEVIAMHNRENTDKPVRSIKQAYGGFMGGEDKATEIVLDKLWELKKVGVHFIAIGHTKKRDIEDPVTGQTYSILTTNISNRYFNALKTKLHFLGVASIDREIVQQKTGKKNIVTKKEEVKGVITGESRKITFRDDNYSIDSKSRFANIIPETPLDADAFIKALTDAIKSEQSKSNKSYDETLKEQQATELEKLKDIAATEQQKKKNKELKGILSQITDFIKNNKSNMSEIKPILDLTKELGYTNPTQINNIDDAQKILELIL